MQTVLVMGAGHIGSLIAYLLAKCNQYNIYLADAINKQYPDYLTCFPHVHPLQLDAADTRTLARCLHQHGIKAIISSLPYRYNLDVAKIAAENKIAYFDLTEDVATTQGIMQLAENAKQPFAPQCGLAPGFINIVANDLMRDFSKAASIKLRVGALPQNVDNSLHYALTWSTAGLINEYGNSCQAIANGVVIEAEPLEDLEEIIIDGIAYEAFNTSGGIGSLVETYTGLVNELNYKTIRYKGHCEKIKFLMNDLKLNQERELLQHILEMAIPTTNQDIVIVYASVQGVKNGTLIENQFVKKYYPQTLDNITWSAIQLTTASSLCAVFDIVMQQPEKYHGFIRQEDFSLNMITDNQLGHYLAGN